MRGYGGSCGPTAARIALAASPARPFEIAAAEAPLSFHVADHGLDGGASSQFA
jgi:hypothetical protein